MDPLTQIRAHARAHRHRFDDRPRGRGRRVSRARRCAGLGYDVDRAAGRWRSLQRHRLARQRRRSCSRRTSTACRRSFRAARRPGVLYGRGACDAKGMLVAQIAAAERLRAAGETRVGLVFVVGEERGSEGAKAANTHRAGIAVPDQRRADGQSARRGDARRVSRAADARPAGPRTRACPSWASRRSTSWSTRSSRFARVDVAGGSASWAARSTRSASSAAASRRT